MVTIIKIDCHCGKSYSPYLNDGDAGLLDCECGCSYSYKSVGKQGEVKKVEKCNIESE